jgi:pyrroline-5-carboxylate reductase
LLVARPSDEGWVDLGYSLAAMRIGFAGAGNMAAAMARGWAAAEGGPDQMLFTDLDAARAAALAEKVGGEQVESIAELARRCDLLVLAVKPGALEEVATEAQGATAVLSLLGAVPLQRVADAFPGASVMRVMPNQPVAVHRGVLCYTAGEGTPQELDRDVRRQLALLGRVVDVDDDLFDTATALSGCSPAYLALVVSKIAEAGAADGLDAELALSLMVDTAAGTAELLRQRDPEGLIGAVASPGGSTEAGLEALEREGVADALEQAVRASLARMRG